MRLQLFVVLALFATLVTPPSIVLADQFNLNGPSKLESVGKRNLRVDENDGSESDDIPDKHLADDYGEERNAVYWTFAKLFGGVEKFAGRSTANKFGKNAVEFWFWLAYKTGKTPKDMLANANLITDPAKRAKRRATAGRYRTWVKTTYGA
ncbi:Putative RxLR effector [Phytophthora palmivora]|uniref:RxLR effector n=1 Tax=Phytophthora palmivora TaxID=4796 RepID=A0A2P4YC73_9STRA|nr:Putative RxLR effector [Phytophthora palmivora]